MYAMRSGVCELGPWPIARLMVELPIRSMEKTPNSFLNPPASTTMFSAGTRASSK